VSVFFYSMGLAMVSFPLDYDNVYIQYYFFYPLTTKINNNKIIKNKTDVVINGPFFFIFESRVFFKKT